jgi:hypothetical protein
MTEALAVASINKIRAYVSGGKVVRCDGDYAKKATDIRYVVLPIAEYDISAVGRTHAKPSVLARESNADVAINFPYFNESDGALLGHNVVAGSPLTYEVAKTAARHEFYRKDGVYHVGDTKGLTVDFAVQGSPVLLRDKAIVVAESIARDQTGADIVNGRCQRTAVGIRANGDVVFVVSDGRLATDIGLTLGELALVMRDELDCVDAINGDGGGSPILYANGEVVNQRTNRDDERGTGCALIAKKKAVVAVPVTSRFKRYTLDEYVKYLESFTGRVKFNEVHVHGTDQPTIADFRRDGGLKLVQAMWRFHTSVQKWADIAQHATVDPDGYVWEGRSLLSAPASATGHNGDGASHPFMFEMIGHFDKGGDVLGGAQLATALGLCRAVMRLMGRGPEIVHFHRDFTNAKTCPGSGVDRAEFFRQLTVQVSAPPPTPTTPKVGDPVNVIVNVDGKAKKLADGHLTNGVTYAPVRAVAEALGDMLGVHVSVAWDAKTNTVTITK